MTFEKPAQDGGRSGRLLLSWLRAPIRTSPSRRYLAIRMRAEVGRGPQEAWLTML